MPRVATVILDGLVIERKRLALLWTPADLAKRAGLSKQTIWCARTGRPVGVNAARRITRVLGLGLRALAAPQGLSAGPDFARLAGMAGIDEGQEHGR
jgi:hypothetical protein